MKDRMSLHQSGDPLTVGSVIDKLRQGDPIARGVIDEYVSMLSILCISMVNSLNPQLILVGGKLAQNMPEIADMLQSRIHRDLLAPAAEAVHVKTAKHGRNGVILGAVSLVLYELFEPLHRVSVRATPGRNPALAEPLVQD